MAKKWLAKEILDISRGFQPACVLFAAADLDVFTVLRGKSLSAGELAGKIKTNPRATAVLLNALAALKLLIKVKAKYRMPRGVDDMLTENGSKTVLSGLRHQANCMRRWVQLAEVVRTGRPAKRQPSIRGSKDDLISFINAMDNFSSPIAAGIIGKLGRLKFEHLLDVGGASGTWTIAFLKAFPKARATLFDLPEVIPLARKRIAKSGLRNRVTIIGGDMFKDKLPRDSDFVWLSAIAHQNSRKENQQLFAKIYSAMKKGGILAIRDVVMDKSGTRPQTGALFAVNMLVGTAGGGTYTFDEFKEDLVRAGFKKIALIHQDEAMNSLIRAQKP